MYIIEYLDSVVNNDIPALSLDIRKEIKKAIEKKLTVDPVNYGKPLQYSLKGHRRLRVGDYRVIYRIENEKKIVLVTAISHRKNVYADA